MKLLRRMMRALKTEPTNRAAGFDSYLAHMANRCLADEEAIRKALHPEAYGLSECDDWLQREHKQRISK